MKPGICRFLKTSVLAVGVAVAAIGSAQATTINLIEGADNPITELSSALLAASSGINIQGGSETFVGRVGDGIDPNTAQSATFTGTPLVPNNGGLPTIQMPGQGILLTSGTANVPFAANNDSSWDHFSTTTTAPGTGSDTDLANILTTAGAPSNVTNDVNYFEFQFTVDNPGTNNAVMAEFVFASDEFPDQAVTDVFAIIVDGVNYAFFPDSSLVSFVQGANAGNFNNNTAGSDNYDIEFDGISNKLSIIGLLDDQLSTHTLKIAIADTSDDIFDSGVFIGGLHAIETDSETGGVPGIPEPATLPLFAGAVLGLAWLRQRKR